jgi:hypothetical protein
MSLNLWKSWTERGIGVEIEIVKSNADRIVGLLEDIDMDSVELQHATKDIWMKRVASD